MIHPNMLDCHLRCMQCGLTCADHENGKATECPGFLPPEDLSAFADEAQQVCRPIAEHSGATVLVLVFDAKGGFEVRSTNEGVDLNVAVGALHRAAATVHAMSSLMHREVPGKPATPEAAG